MSNPYGNVLVQRVDSNQGEIPGVDNHFIIMGVGTKNNGDALTINQESDLDDLLGVNNSEIKSNVLAASLNGGQGWSCTAVPYAQDESWTDHIDNVLNQVEAEGILVCTPVIDQAGINNFYAKIIDLANQSRFMFGVIAVDGIDSANETWAQYVTRLDALQDGIAADAVALCPQIHELDGRANNIGVLAGRLASRNASIADSTLRVRTGAVVGLGESQQDSTGATVDSATLQALSAERYSVPRTWPEYDGQYWTATRTLAAAASDYQRLENLRVVIKGMREVYVLAVSKIGDRSFNNTPQSLATHQSFFARPLRAMAKKFRQFDEEFPGLINEPSDEAVLISFVTKTSVRIGIRVQPLDSAEEIEVFFGLDLSLS